MKGIRTEGAHHKLFVAFAIDADATATAFVALVSLAGIGKNLECDWQAIKVPCIKYQVVS